MEQAFSLINKSLLKYSLSQNFPFFQSVNIRSYQEPIKGLILGICWDLDGNPMQPLNIENGHIHYCVYQNDEGSIHIFEETEKKLTCASHSFPEIVFPSTAPKYKIGDRLEDPEGDFWICSCQWGDLDYHYNFIPGWRYEIFWTVNEREYDTDFFWDLDAMYTEEELTEQTLSYASNP
jgi:hypothetical protein